MAKNQEDIKSGFIYIKRRERVILYRFGEKQPQLSLQDSDAFFSKQAFPHFQFEESVFVPVREYRATTRPTKESTVPPKSLVEALVVKQIRMKWKC